MSEWVERIGGHPVWQQMRELGPAIDVAAAREGIEAAALDGLERVRTVLAFVGRRLGAADPVLLRVAPLDALNTHLQAVTSEVQAFSSDGDMSHLSRANGRCDEALNSLSDLVYPTTSEDLSVIMEAASNYRSSLERALAEVKDQARKTATSVQDDASTVQQKLSELQTDISNERSRLTALTSDFQSQFSSAQESRVKEFSEGQTARQDRFTAQQNEFNASQTQRQQRLETLHGDFSAKLTEQDNEFTRLRDVKLRQQDEEIAALKTQYVDAGQKILAQIEQHKSDVEKLVGVIGNLGVTSGYSLAADHARKLTWLWQTVTVAAMAGLIWVAVEAFLPTIIAHPANQQFDWPGFAGRVFVSLTVGVLAAYAAAQADRQSEIEKKNRKLALELQAVGPYLAPLPEEQQHKFIVELGERSFGRDEAPGGKTSPATTVDLLLKSKEFNQLVTTVAKTVSKQG